MTIIRKIIKDGGIVGYCHNPNCIKKSCSYQGASGLEGYKFTCAVCGKLMHTEEKQ